MKNIKYKLFCKKVTIGICLFLLSITVVSLFPSNCSRVFAENESITQAGDYIVVTYDIADAKTHIGSSAPELPDEYIGWIFSGWYEEAECVTPVRNKNVTGEYCYAKFVSEDILTVKCQTKIVTDESSETEKSNLRFVSSIDSKNYYRAGFEVSRQVVTDGVTSVKTYTNKTNTSFRKIVASTEAKVAFDYTSKVIDTESESFITYTITNIPSTSYDTEFLVKPFWVTLDGVTVYGVSRYVTINDYSQAVVDVPVKVEARTAGETESDEELYQASEFTLFEGESEISADDMAIRYRAGEDYASIILSDKTSLSSATLYQATVKDSEGNDLTTYYVYRNLDTTHVSDSSTPNVDKSWYTAANSQASALGRTENEYVVVTSADLYGLADLVDGGITFSENTVYVVADISINEGTADANGFELADSSDTIYKWNPIGTFSSSTDLGAFVGTFDGQGHTLSGFFSEETEGVQVGLFGSAYAGSNICNFKLVNSYFHGENYVSAIVGQGASNLNTIYTDAILVAEDMNSGTNYGRECGGFVGQMRGDTTITNCWSGGILETYLYSGGFVGNVASGSLTITECLSTANIHTTRETEQLYVGGFVGSGGTKAVSIENSMNLGKVIVDYASATHVGTVAGYGTNLTISNIYTSTTDSLEATIQGASTNENVVAKELEEYLGINAKTNTTDLDWAKTWIIVQEAKPALKSFADEAEGVVADIDWYENGTYEIEDVADFYGFAELSKITNFSGLTVTLGNDIIVNEDEASTWHESAPEITWTPIGSDVAGTRFAGIFDGDGKTVSGLYTNGTNKVGMFSTTDTSAVIKNVKLTNSYFKGTYAVGSVVGFLSGELNNIYSNAIVVAEDADSTSGGRQSGGIAGSVRSNDAKLTKCWFAGTLEGDTYLGGILGDTNSKTGITISDCLFRGIIHSDMATTSSDLRIGGIIGRVIGTGSTMTDCVSVGEINIEYGDESADYIGSVIGLYSSVITCTDVYTSTEYLTNSVGKKEQDAVAGITELTETNLIGVYAKSNGTGLDWVNNWILVHDGTPVLRNFKEEANGILAETDWYDTEEFILNDMYDLYGFAEISKLTNFSGVTIKLGKDITLNKGDDSEWKSSAPEIVWSPIASSKSFQGTFDGQEHSISGLYATSTEGTVVGLFGKVAKEATIKNLKLLNSYIHGENYVGSLVGQGAGMFENVYVDIELLAEDVDSSGNSGREIGGFIGQMNNTTSFKNCWFNGTVETDLYAGGFIGNIPKTYGVTFNDCLFTGTIAGRTDDGGKKYIGGFVGNVGGASGSDIEIVMTDSLSAGTISNLNASVYVGSVVGFVNADRTYTFTNVYATNESYAQQGTSPFAGVKGTKAITEVMSQEAKEYYGVDGYKITKLNFDETWVALDGKTPELEAFSTGEALSVNNLQRVDIGWYDVNEEEYFIADADDLLGLSHLGQDRNFEDKIIKLKNDITLNTGNAAEWDQTAPTKEWTPIGNGKAFAGTFDGCKYTISGLYATMNINGLFGKTASSAQISNLNLANSYFSGEYQIGTIVGRGSGTFDSIYVHEDVVLNAVATSTNANGGRECGGIVGQLNADGTFANCWVAANMETDTYSGGLVGNVSGATAKISIDNCLFTGKISGRGRAVTYHYIGGFVGNIAGPSEVPETATPISITSSLSAGSIKNYDTCVRVGSMVGYINGYRTEQTWENVYASEECYMQQGYSKFAGLFGGSAISDITFVAEDRLLGYGAYLNAHELGYDNSTTTDTYEGTWVLRENAAPTLRIFASSADVLVNPETYIPTLDGASEAEAYGDGNYVSSLADATSDDYTTYLDMLAADNFVLYNSNTIADTVTTKTYTKDNVAVVVSYMDETDNTDTIYVSVSSSDVLSEHLNRDDVDHADDEGVGYTATQGVITETRWHMLYQSAEYGDSYVIQLKNGHFIVLDGGMPSETENLLLYLESLVPEGKKPIVDAWFLSHSHKDHIGALNYLITEDTDSEDDVTYTGNINNPNRIFVEGIYFSEPNTETIEYYSAPIFDRIKNIARLLNATDGGHAKLYRPKTGQTYLFSGGVMIDIMLTQEQIPFASYGTESGYDDDGGQGYNESSTWCMFRFAEGESTYKVLYGADGGTADFTFVKNVYSTDYMTVNVLHALHHANVWNTTEEFINYCTVTDKIILHTESSDDVINPAYVLYYEDYTKLSFGNGPHILYFKETGIEIVSTNK